MTNRLQSLKENSWATVATVGFAAMSAMAGFLGANEMNSYRIDQLEDALDQKADIGEVAALTATVEGHGATIDEMHPRKR